MAVGSSRARDNADGWMWANVKSAAKKWAHNRSTKKGDWGARGRAKGALKGRKKK